MRIERAPGGAWAARRPDEMVDRSREFAARAADDWGDVAMLCLQRLVEFASGGPSSVSAGEAYALVHLCAEKGEKGAYPVICRLIGEDREISEWLEDAVTETLPGVLIRLYDGDAGPLRQAVEAQDGDEFARASALAALGYLVRAEGAMSDEDMRAYLRRIRSEIAPRRESVLWMNWAATVASLGYADMRADVSELRRSGFVPDGDFSNNEFDLRVSLAQSDPSGLAGFAHDLIEPFEDATFALRRFAGVASASAGQSLRSVALDMKGCDA